MGVLRTVLEDISRETSIIFPIKILNHPIPYNNFKNIGNFFKKSKNFLFFKIKN